MHLQTVNCKERGGIIASLGVDSQDSAGFQNIQYVLWLRGSVLLGKVGWLHILNDSF